MIILFTRSGGRELIVEVTPRQGGERIRLLVPRQLLDDELGGEANEFARRAYVRKHDEEIQKVGDAVARGSGTIRIPFNKIVPFND